MAKDTREPQVDMFGISRKYDKEKMRKIYPKNGEFEEAKKVEYEEFTFKKSLKQRFLRIEPYIQDIAIGVFYVALIIQMIFKTLNIMLALKRLDIGYLNFNVAYLIACTFVPFVVWSYLTTRKYFNRNENLKVATLAVTIVSFLFVIGQVVYATGYYLIAPIILKLPITRHVTAGMIYGLAKLVLQVMVVTYFAVVIPFMLKRVLDEKNRPQIVRYRVDRDWDPRSNKEYCYDMKFFKEAKNGKMHPVVEKQRFTNTVLFGVSGTGKTSSSINVQCINDLNQRVKNEDTIKKRFYRLIKDGHLRVKGIVDDEAFDPSMFEPTDKIGEKAYQKTLSSIKLAGMTVVAPNASLSDAIYDFASKRRLKVNRVDPVVDFSGRHKPGYIGYNPMYVDDKLEGLARRNAIAKTAECLADTLLSVDNRGKSSPYFDAMSYALAANVTKVLLVSFEAFENRKPNLSDLQEILSCFIKIKDYALAMMKDETVYRLYRSEVDYCILNLLGPGSQKTFTDTSSIRVILDKILSNTLFKEILCSENSIDLDRALEKGEITVFNFALEQGIGQAKAFGSFFLLSLNNAVLRRPGTEDTRLPHWLYIDELPVIISPALETIWSMYRQFRVASMVAVQNLKQCEKDGSLAFLKDTIVSNTSTQVFFGRLGKEEMELIEKIGGTHEEMVEQETISQTSITMEDTQLSSSTRITPTEKKNVSGSDARYREFGGVTVFTVDRFGGALPAFSGFVDFVPKAEKMGRKRVKIDWTKLYDDQTQTTDSHGQTDESDMQGELLLCEVIGGFSYGADNNGTVNEESKTEPEIESQEEPDDTWFSDDMNESEDDLIFTD